ncbi:D-glucuronyl C5-epimerase family protein [Odoribacter sp. AF15-53]|uniref:D-glucuronyl C5-epimerase family protein n=1 Tax=Odoribacter sp. AF15-53 TaxID=2292236 RepID=UPI000E4B1002|nr:D-glucuronyl C5-epimerase family protein [Odoribacter sp. AF15-53]RHR77783.1 hypothetical protein DWW52_14030 [Odoribacter sp. AF15-53]
MKIKNAIFFGKRMLTDFNENKHLTICLDNKNSKLSCYYFVFEEDKINTRGGNHPFLFDAQGIPQVHSYIDVVDTKGYFYYPITIGQYALAVFHTWLKTQDPDKKAYFLRFADWFMDKRTDDPMLGTYWLTETAKPEYGVNTPWKSAFAQSRAISVLLRAWQLTGDKTYLETATRALIPFTKDITSGGVSVDREKGETFYEEYVAAKPTRVLDGHGFCLFGLYDYIRAVPESVNPNGHALAQQLFDEGVEGLIRQIPKFDMGFWSRFNRCDLPGYPQDDPCTIGYLRLVRQQFLILHGLTGREELHTFSEKFRHYDRIPNILKMYRHKFRALKKLNRL